MKTISGTGVALITPFDALGSIDFASLKRLVDRQIEGGIDFFVVMGTTSEAATLTVEEREAVTEAIVKYTAGRIPLVLGISGNSTSEMLVQLRSLTVAGFEAIMMVSPYYNKPTQKGIEQHFSALCSESPLPVILYNVPGRTGSNVLPSTFLALIEKHDNIIGIKEASGDIVQGMELLYSLPNRVSLLVGDDAITAPLVAMGAHGAISVYAMAFPNQYVEMVNTFSSGDVPTGRKHLSRMLQGMDLIFREGNPAGIKGLLKEQGITETAQVRLPLVACSETLRKELIEHVNTVTQ